jgi:hypothetical protein
VEAGLASTAKNTHESEQNQRWGSLQQDTEPSKQSKIETGGSGNRDRGEDCRTKKTKSAARYGLWQELLT